jgi:colanic acid/amylovoran biosynthesis glycosyltransferase
MEPFAGDNASARPPVSVIIPFGGSAQEVPPLERSIERLELAAGDQVIVIDNTPAGLGLELSGARTVRAADHRSSYYARNVGAEAAECEWLLFIDADCIPEPELLNEYFAPEPAASEGALAGELTAAGDHLLSRYAVARGMLSQSANLSHPHAPAAVTANLLVRRAAWHSVGGFQEGIRSGGDTDFCWRLQDAGWALGYRPSALVQHRHRETMRGLARQLARHGAGAAWLGRRYPGSMIRPRLAAGLARSLAGAVVWGLSGNFERARFKAIDAPVVVATNLGYVSGNAARRALSPGADRGGIVVLADSFPHLSETFVMNEARALMRRGERVRVEALSRPARPLRGGIRGLPVSFREDDALARRLSDGVWLVARHPLRALRDAASQRRWRRGGDHVTRLPSIAMVARRAVAGSERHLHAHFATSAALEARRLALILGLPHSVAPHAFEIFARPANLAEKLESASFVVTDCYYNVRHLRAILSPDAGRRVHEIVLGIDEARFVRRRPLPGTRVVGSVGRLVEKKGFEYLVEAVAELERKGDPIERLVIAGDGPLRDDLIARADELGVGGRLELPGALEPDEVLDMLHEFDVFALPCVVARDGDRDSMPVVIKEALAMEIIVAGTDEVGLPEMIRPEWGRLVPPRDAKRLAGALGELLALDSRTRAAMGAAGRAFVLERCNVDREAGKLVDLIDATPQSLKPSDGGSGSLP